MPDRFPTVKTGTFFNAMTWASRLVGDKRGISAIEFALLFPVLLFMFAGTVDLGRALMVSRKMNQIVSTAGDSISQKSSWASSDVSAILAGISTFILPFDTSTLTIQVNVLDVDSKLNATINWSKAFQTTVLTKGAASPVSIAATVKESGVQLVLVRATYSLTTPFSSLLQPVTGLTSYNISKNYIMRPRIKDTISLN